MPVEEYEVVQDALANAGAALLCAGTTMLASNAAAGVGGLPAGRPAYLPAWSAHWAESTQSSGHTCIFATPLHPQTATTA